MGRAAPGPCPLPLRSHVPIPRYRPVPGPPRRTRQSAPPLLCPASRGPISTAFTLLRLSRANQRDPWWCARAGSFRKRLGSASGGAGPAGRGARGARPQRGRARGRGAGGVAGGAAGARARGGGGGRGRAARGAGSRWRRAEAAARARHGVPETPRAGGDSRASLPPSSPPGAAGRALRRREVPCVRG